MLKEFLGLSGEMGLTGLENSGNLKIALAVLGNKTYSTQGIRIYLEER